MERDSFVFYRSFFEAIEDVDEKTQLELFKAICKKSLNDEEIELEGLAKTLFKLIEPQLVANNERYANGSKGGRPKKETKKPVVSKTKKPMVFENENQRF